MGEPTNWSLLARYLSDECSEEEKGNVEAWIRSDPEHQRLVERMGIIWNTPEAELQPSDVKKLWMEIIERGGIASGPRDLKAPAPPQPAPRTVPWPFALQWSAYRILRYARELWPGESLPDHQALYRKLYTPGLDYI